jgi:hypothetical protein
MALAAPLSHQLYTPHAELWTLYTLDALHPTIYVHALPPFPYTFFMNTLNGAELFPYNSNPLPESLIPKP